MSDMEQIFRPEVIAARRSRLGNPASSYGLRTWPIIGLMGIILLTVSVFVSGGTYTKTETVTGMLVPAAGVSKIVSPKSGVIEHVFARSDEMISAGQPLFQISYDSVLATGGKLSEQLSENSKDQLQSTLDEAVIRKRTLLESRAELTDKLAGLTAQIASLKLQLEMQTKQVGLKQKTVEAGHALEAKQYISALQVRQFEDALLQAQLSVSATQQSIDNADNQISQIRRQISESDLSVAEVGAGLSLSRAQLHEKEITDQLAAGVRINAPKGGRITALQVKPGDSVLGGQPLALIVPGGVQQDEQVELWVPSRSIGFVKVGDEVRLMMDAFPFQTYGAAHGVVAEIATAPLNPNELPVPLDTKEQMFKILVAIKGAPRAAYGKAWVLRPGMRVTADLVLDKKSFLAWILDPITATHQRATG